MLTSGCPAIVGTNRRKLPAESRIWLIKVAGGIVTRDLGGADFSALKTSRGTGPVSYWKGGQVGPLMETNVWKWSPAGIRLTKMA